MRNVVLQPRIDDCLPAPLPPNVDALIAEANRRKALEEASGQRNSEVASVPELLAAARTTGLRGRSVTIGGEDELDSRDPVVGGVLAMAEIAVQSARQNPETRPPRRTASAGASALAGFAKARDRRKTAEQS